MRLPSAIKYLLRRPPRWRTSPRRLTRGSGPLPIDIVSIENQVADRVAIRENKLTLVERLADDLAHEIKNPLHSMVINLEVLRRRLTRLNDGAGDDLLRYAGILDMELERINRRIDLLLRVVRPNRESDEPASLGDILEELKELLTLECEQHGVGLDTCFPLPQSRVRLPRASARQVILGLVLKTLDSMDAGGTLFLAIDGEGESVRVGIAATGPDGAPLPPPDAGEPEAGLAVARALAESLGGGVEVQGVVNTDFGILPEATARFVLSIPAGARWGSP